jgi:hypothetical protein
MVCLVLLYPQVHYSSYIIIINTTCISVQTRMPVLVSGSLILVASFNKKSDPSRMTFVQNRKCLVGLDPYACGV